MSMSKVRMKKGRQRQGNRKEERGKRKGERGKKRICLKAQKGDKVENKSRYKEKITALTLLLRREAPHLALHLRDAHDVAEDVRSEGREQGGRAQEEVGRVRAEERRIRCLEDCKISWVSSHFRWL